MSYLSELDRGFDTLVVSSSVKTDRLPSFEHRHWRTLDFFLGGAARKVRVRVFNVNILDLLEMDPGRTQGGNFSSDPL